MGTTSGVLPQAASPYLIFCPPRPRMMNMKKTLLSSLMAAALLGAACAGAQTLNIAFADP
ncbi:ABC transporter substrate-binding protein, partial [Verminephrobacter sp. Larva24]